MTLPDGLAGILAEATALAEDAGRPDLVAHLTPDPERRSARPARVVVAGDFKSGKSSLVNAVVGEYVCPALPDAATVIPTAVHHGDERRAALLMRGEQLHTRELAVPELVQYACDVESPPPDASDVEACEVTVPSSVLAGGLVLVDMPGAGALSGRFGRMLAVELAAADALLFVSDASQELTAPELDLLRAGIDAVPRVAVAFTKIDLYPEWRRLAAINQGHLAAARIDVPVLAVSARLADLAAARDDPELAAESGIAAIRDHLAAVATAHQSDDLSALEAGIGGALDDMRRLVAKEMEATDPRRAEQAVRDLEASLRHVDEAVSINARWRLRLQDDVRDLDRDVRNLLEALESEAYADIAERIDEIDPGKAPEQLGLWMTERAEAMVASVLEFIGDRSLEIRDRVAATLTMLETEFGDLETQEAARLRLTDVLRYRPGDAERGGIDALSRFWGVGEPLLALAGVVPGLFNPFVLVGAVPFAVRTVVKSMAKKVEARRDAAREDLRHGLDRAKDTILHQTGGFVDDIERRIRDAVLEEAREKRVALQTAVDEARRSQEAEGTDQERRRRALQDRLDAIAALRARVDAGEAHA